MQDLATRGRTKGYSTLNLNSGSSVYGNQDGSIRGPVWAGPTKSTGISQGLKLKCHLVPEQENGSLKIFETLKNQLNRRLGPIS